MEYVLNLIGQYPIQSVIIVTIGIAVITGITKKAKRK